MKCNTVKAIVQAIVPGGKHGPYAVATSDELGGSVTFSLGKDVWHELADPNPGVQVFLCDLQKKRAGWRAMYGRLLRPSDERQPARSNKQ